ncbi:MAG: ACT domain-containing protein [Actinomycetota bacterium]
MATDLMISLDDRPGELARVGEALGAAGVNIEGLCGMGMEGRGLIHICVMDATAAKAALEGAGLKVEGESEAILADPIGTANEPGTMGMIARRVADAGINVRVLYLATNNRAVVVTDDNARAMEVMG